MAEGGQVLASSETVAGSRYRGLDLRRVTLRGIADQVEIVTVEWQ
jgi:hypothetical protein